MKKPWWEEEWLLSAEDPESGPVIGLKGGGVLFDCTDSTRARGAHAAPDMVRALVETERVLKAWHKDRGEWATLREQIRAALSKAGVVLP